MIGLKSLAEGETSALSFELQNICAQALGRDANRRESARGELSCEPCLRLALTVA